MYGLTLSHGKGERCTRCSTPYNENKTFFAFIDPNYHRYAVTLWGSECCNDCAASMQAWGTATRTEIATACGIKMLRLEPVHLCLVSWSYWCPQSYERYGLRQRVPLTQLLTSNMTKGIHHESQNQSTRTSS
ncbi:MAG: hypothetical protein ACKVJE_22220 [Pseudomonadales bacterium]